MKSRFFPPITAFFIILSLMVSISSADNLAVNDEVPTSLYRVEITGPDETDKLNSGGVDILLRLDHGYLILAKPAGIKNLSENGLTYELIATDIDRNHLALDISRRGEARSDLPLIFEENGVRLFRVGDDFLTNPENYPGLAPLMTEGLRAVYRRPLTLDLDKARDLPLDSLISLINQDSLQSYVEALQAFPPRVTGSQADYDSRDWIYDKFIEFGFDSVVFDTFYYSGNNVQNIVAYKTGTTLPDHQIVVGAHKDAVSGSPGADDNGSGSAGVLEIARILKDVETEMTFIFICFDGEEQGLHGSWHYANDAAANGDSIVAMLNMDMIAYYENTNDVSLYHSPDQTYAELFEYLADSLTAINLNAHLSGTISASDHYPFQQNGYDVVFPIEYIFSSVYHSYQDSTSYMDFSYMARIVKAVLATGYQIDGSYIPVPALAFSYPGGLPEIAPPGEEITFQVRIDGSSGGTHIDGSGQIHYSTDGTNYTAAYMTSLGSGLYDAVIPAMTCEDGQVYFYFSGEEQTEGTYYDRGPANPYATYVATGITVAYYDDFDKGTTGWSVSGGLWAIGIPTGGGGQYGGPDPSNAYSLPNVFGYNLSGDYENSIPEYHITSPAIDCSEINGAKLSFMRWLGVEQPAYDHAYVRVSNNGSSWTTIWENGEEITDYAWVEQEFDIAAVADGQSTVYIRFTMGPTDGGWRYCGWNIDNVQLSAYSCESSLLQITTDALPNWTDGQPYSVQLEAINGVGNLAWSDKFDDLIGSGLVLSADGLLSGIPVASGTISFTALVVDENEQSDEQLFSFEINPAIVITTADLPDWTLGQPYSSQLEATGGTGLKTWSDKNGGLVGSGLQISADGLVTGNAVAEGAISFIAEVSDIPGSTDEKQFDLIINPAIQITATAEIPFGYVGRYYELQFEATGGTGAYQWYEPGRGLLAEIGLSINENGMLSGTPTQFANDFDFSVALSDECGASDESNHMISIYYCGDVNHDGSINIIDISFLIAFLYQEGIAPDPMDIADVNNDGQVNILDISGLINYLYNSGTEPVCP